MDSCHALMNYGVDRYKRPQKISMQEERERQEEREAYLQSQVNDLWRTLPETQEQDAKKNRHPLSERSPGKHPVFYRKECALYWSPGKGNWSGLCSKGIPVFLSPETDSGYERRMGVFLALSHILNHLYDEGKVTDRFIMEFLHSHTNVVAQPDYNSPYYSGINPYALGFNMFMDIKRVCQEPTEEDKYWLPEIAGKDWLETVHFAMQNFKDESFISQFLSPKLIRDFKLFAIEDNEKEAYLNVSAIHDEEGYRAIREKLSAQYNLSNLEPNIQVFDVDVRGNRSLTLRYVPHNNIPLADSRHEVMKHLHRLWGFDVNLEQREEDGKITHLARCPEASKDD